MTDLNRRQQDNKFIVFDRTINVGNILAIIIFIIALMQMYSGIVQRMDIMQFKIDVMWNAFKIEVDGKK